MNTANGKPLTWSEKAARLQAERPYLTWSQVCAELGRRGAATRSQSKPKQKVLTDVRLPYAD